MQKQVFLSKKSFAGIDLLKFFMALMIIAVHVKPFDNDPILKSVFLPFIKAAVPTFFLISAFLLFRKMAGKSIQEGVKDRIILKRFISRICILYSVWFLIEIPYIYIYKGYFFNMGMIDSFVLFFKDLLFGSTYPGSWFLSALVVSVLFVYLLSRLFGILPTLLISLFISSYFSFHTYLPFSMQTAYDWYSLRIREEVNCSFPIALVWISFGQYLAQPSVIKSFSTIASNNRRELRVLLFIFFIIMSLSSNPDLFKYPFVVFLFILAQTVPITPKPIHKYLRNVSILMYLFHFSIAGKKGLFLNAIGSKTTFWQIVFYVIVVIVCLIFATCVLRLEKHKHLFFLRYTH